MNSSTPRITIVIPNWNGRCWLPDCLTALRDQSYRDFAVILVDNGSDDGSVDYVESSFPEVIIHRMGHNSGFGAAVNAGIERSRSPYIALLNTDTRADARWLEELVGVMNRADRSTACLASRMLDMSDPSLMENGGDKLTTQGLAYKRGHGCPASDYEAPTEVFSSCAGAALYRRDLFEEVGGFDESFFAYLEDVDLGLRARLRGYRCFFVPAATVLHRGHGSSLPRGRYVKYVTRNCLLMLVKNFPLSTLLKNIHRLAYGQLYIFLVSRRPFSSLAGYASFVVGLPSVLRQRREVLAKMSITPAELECQLTRESPAPSLTMIISRRLGLSRPEKCST